MQRKIVVNIGNCLMELAEYLTDEEYEITANEILTELSGKLISEEDAGYIRKYVGT